MYHKNTYYEEKTKYQGNNKKGKITIVERILQLDSRHKSMKQSLQASIRQNKEQPNLQNLAKSDVSLTCDLNETVNVMIDYLIPKDEQLDDKYYHNRIRAQSKNPF